MLSLQRKFLYIHIPKTAGNSVQNVLRHYSEDKVVCLTPYQDGVERFEVRNDRFTLQKHSTLAEYQRELGDATLTGLFKFCCVRNPWERAISFYFSPHRGVTQWDRASFIALLKDMLPATAYLQSAGTPAALSAFENVDCIMRFERLEQDFSEVCERLDIPKPALAVRNKSARAHFSTYYDEELVELVRRRFTEDIAPFGYEFEGKPFRSATGDFEQEGTEVTEEKSASLLPPCPPV
jgi:hypothetical protein